MSTLHELVAEALADLREARQLEAHLAIAEDIPERVQAGAVGRHSAYGEAIARIERIQAALALALAPEASDGIAQRDRAIEGLSRELYELLGELEPVCSPGADLWQFNGVLTARQMFRLYAMARREIPK